VEAAAAARWGPGVTTQDAQATVTVPGMSHGARTGHMKYSESTRRGSAERRPARRRLPDSEAARPGQAEAAAGAQASLEVGASLRLVT
jgi:hypothetical protein